MSNQLDIYLSGISDDQNPVIQLFNKDYENQMYLHIRNVTNKDIVLEKDWSCHLKIKYGNKSGSLTKKEEMNRIKFVLPNHVCLKSEHPAFDTNTEEGTAFFDLYLSEQITIPFSDEIKITIEGIYSNTPVGRTTIAIAYFENGIVQNKEIDVSKEKLQFFIDKFETDTVPGLGYPLKVRWSIQGCIHAFFNNEFVSPVGEKDVQVTGEMELTLEAVGIKGNRIQQKINIVPSGPVIKVFEFYKEFCSCQYQSRWQVLYADKVTLDGNVVPAEGTSLRGTADKNVSSPGGPTTVTVKHDLWAVGYNNEEVKKHIEITYTYQIT